MMCHPSCFAVFQLIMQSYTTAATKCYFIALDGVFVCLFCLSVLFCFFYIFICKMAGNKSFVLKILLKDIMCWKQKINTLQNLFAYY